MTAAFDPNMRIALLLGQAVQYQPLALPASLSPVKDRAAFIETIDHPLLVDFDGVYQWRGLGCYLEQLVEQTRGAMPDIEQDNERVSIALRLWAGCLMAAKAIGAQTRSGPNSKESRMAAFQTIDPLATHDLIYAAGVQAAPAFLAGRSQSYSLDGVPANSRVRLYADSGAEPTSPAGPSPAN